MKKTTRKHWTGKPKEKGQSFQATVTVLKITPGSAGVPSVISINGEDFVRRPK